MPEGGRRMATVLAWFVPLLLEERRLRERTAALPAAAQAVEYAAFHERHKDEPLQLILELRGFWVKLGQKLAGLPGEIPPDAYKSVLKVLQEDVPPQPFARIRQIIESELGLPLEDVFDEFDERPLGALARGGGRQVRER